MNQETVIFCRGVLERHARSFSLAGRFLTPEMRDQAAIVYAFCRLVDDTVDEATDDAVAQAELAEIEEMLNGLRQRTPVVEAYVHLCGELGIGLDPARDLIEGARTDLNCVRVQNDAEFFLYCYRVAGTVGKMMCGVLGVRDPKATKHAVDLGIAMQITNICRDVLEDAQRNRRYLPWERFASRRVDGDEIVKVACGQSASLSAKTHSALRLIVGELLQEAESYYASGRAGMGYIPRGPRLAIMIAQRLYREIGVVLTERGLDPWKGRTRVPAWRKWSLVLASALTWCSDILKKPSALTQTDARLLAK